MVGGLSGEDYLCLPVAVAATGRFRPEKLYEVFEQLQLLCIHMDAHSLRYHHRRFPRFGRVS
jgi:hypothetical protein